MSDIGKFAVVAVAAALCAVVVRRQAPEIALALALCAGVVLLFGCAVPLAAVLEFCGELAQAGGLSESLLRPVGKVAGIGLVTRAAADICTDAKESGLAGAVETAGTLLALGAALPLMTAVLQALGELL